MRFFSACRTLLATTTLLALGWCAATAHAVQGNNNNNNGLGGIFGFGTIGAVGGVKADPNGVLEAAASKLSNEDRQRLLDAIAIPQSSDLGKTTELRKVSLRGLYNAVEKAAREQKPLPPEVAFMAGLQRIEFVAVDPDQNDIILAGPAEGWKVDEQGNVVGVTTGCPVLRLEDFLVALRTVQNARQDAGISCSINPTTEGVAALNKLYQSMNGDFRPDAAKTIEEACGPQVITLTGLPADSRFAQVLVAADYKMKRLSMGFEPAPIEGLPSYLQLAQQKGTSKVSSSPRFWMECSYQPLGRSDDGLTWQLRGPGVKTLVEEGRVTEKGTRVAAGKSNGLADKWAQTMTEKFDQLASKEPAFRELRNLMDMSVVAALISKENMLERAGLEIPLFTDETKLPTPTYNEPKSVPTQCSFVRLTSSWLVTASGGVQVDPWSVVENSEVLGSIAQLASSRAADSTFWWN